LSIDAGASFVIDASRAEGQSMLIVRGWAMTTTIYTDGTYHDSNPDWHMADSGWKAGRVAGIVERNRLAFETCVEVGCGGGLFLALLAARFPERRFTGYDVSQDAARSHVVAPCCKTCYSVAV
jgi:2-polyprenyl-3-methyl-5-hydroxy-6-metoxy-1,4-benzoquinol methylase